MVTQGTGHRNTKIVELHEDQHWQKLLRLGMLRKKTKKPQVMSKNCACSILRSFYTFVLLIISFLPHSVKYIYEY